MNKVKLMSIMDVCVYIYVFIYLVCFISTCLCIYLFLFISTCVCLYLFVCVSFYILCLLAYVYIYLYLRVLLLLLLLSSSPSLSMPLPLPWVSEGNFSPSSGCFPFFLKQLKCSSFASFGRKLPVKGVPSCMIWRESKEKIGKFSSWDSILLSLRCASKTGLFLCVDADVFTRAWKYLLVNK